MGVTGDIYVLAAFTNGRRFVFLFDEDRESLERLLETICEYAEDPEMGLGWETARDLIERAYRMRSE